MKKPISKALILTITAYLLYYFLLPAINIHDIALWFILLILAIEYLLLSLTNATISIIKTRNSLSADFGKGSKIVGIVALVAVGVMMISSFIFSPLFQSNKYASRITLEDVSFSEVPAYSFNQTAIIDRDSANNLGNKVMGEMTDLVSQFSVSDEYSQISYQGGTYRVTPLAYEGLIKYFKNRSNGIPGYILVNTTTGATKLVRLENKMHYSASAMFNENLMRKLRFAYPFDIFDTPTFEIDENGNPFYVCTTYTYTGIHSLKKVNGVVIFDPCNGKSRKYGLDEVPDWVDRVYPERLVNEELNDYGLYHNGFFNSIFGQEGVIQTSEGYNYISKNGDIWLYTGMTSTLSDSSNVGFAIVNLRTHEAQYIKTSGADEYAVMASAEGETSDYGYTATFPVLVNINNEPVYLLSLKDSAGLVKMYAMVDAQDYQQVYTIRAEKNARQAIETLISQLSGNTFVSEETSEKTITIDEIKEVIINGNTLYYLLAKDEIYVLTINEDNAAKAVFLKAGDNITINCSKDNIIYDIK